MSNMNKVSMMQAPRMLSRRKEKRVQFLAYNIMCSYIRNEPELGNSEKEGCRKKLAKTTLEQARCAVYG